MFRDMIESYDDFGSDIDTGSLDPFAFLSLDVIEEAGICLGIDRELLATGAAVAILCGLVDGWDQCDPELVPHSPWCLRTKEVLEEGLLWDYPDLEDVPSRQSPGKKGTTVALSMIKRRVSQLAVSNTRYSKAFTVGANTDASAARGSRQRCERYQRRVSTRWCVKTGRSPACPSPRKTVAH